MQQGNHAFCESCALCVITTERRTNLSKTIATTHQNMALITNVRDLEVFKLAYHSALEIYNITKEYPQEEKYDLTSQIRRSSKSVCGCLLEAWRRRRYPKKFVQS